MLKGLNNIKNAVENNSNGQYNFIKIPQGQSITVRILTPPSEICAVYEHVVQTSSGWRSFACPGQGCPVCAEGSRPSMKAFISVLDIKDNDVKVWRVNKTTLSQLIVLMEKYGDNIKEYDIEVTRRGSGRDTQYVLFVTPPIKQIDLSKYQPIDVTPLATPKTLDDIDMLLHGAGESEESKHSVDVVGNTLPF